MFKFFILSNPTIMVRPSKAKLLKQLIFPLNGYQ
jgi:hypothetical protein